MTEQEIRKRIEELRPCVTEHKYEMIKRIVKNRTKQVTLVLEDICQPHNAAAVCRTAEGLGINDIYVVEDRYLYRPSETVDKGATKWLSIKKFSSTQECFAQLRQLGYTIIVTTPHRNGCSLDKLVIDSKIALVFGNEQVGVSTYALEHADGYISIPMLGFTESFNISVTTGICLYDIMHKIRSSESHAWQLTDLEQAEIELEWLGRIVKGMGEREKKNG
jgi:tRNA (guanosine-2'-O-)-methyltransferase